MSSTKVDAMIKKLTENLQKLKVAAKEAEKAKKAADKKAANKAKKSSKGKDAKVSKDKKSKADRPKSIGSCTTKTQLMLFTVAELKEWLIAKKAEKLTGLLKEDLAKLVLKKLKSKKSVETQTDSESGSSSEESEDDFLSSDESSESD